MEPSRCPFVTHVSFGAAVMTNSVYFLELSRCAFVTHVSFGAAVMTNKV